HPDPEAVVERAFHFDAGAFRRLEVRARPEERVALPVVAGEAEEPAFEIDVFDGPGDLHRKLSRVSSPRAATQAKSALARSQNGTRSEGIQGSATVRQSDACRSVPAQPKASPAASPPNAVRSGRAAMRAGSAIAKGTRALQPR